MHFLKIYLCSAFCISILSDQAVAQIKKVWVLGGGAKVYRYDKTKGIELSVDSLIPKALSEVGMKDPVPWSERGDDFDRVRGELLKLL